MRMLPLHKGSSKMTLFIRYIRFSLLIYISVIRIFLFSGHSVLRLNIFKEYVWIPYLCICINDLKGSANLDMLDGMLFSWICTRVIRMKVINIVNLFYLIVCSHMYAKQPLTVILPHQYASFFIRFWTIWETKHCEIGTRQAESTVRSGGRYCTVLTHFAFRVDFFNILYFFIKN